MRTLLLILLAATPLLAQTSHTIANFETGDLKGWQTSMSPEYYKGDAGQKGLQVIADPERGKVLAADVRFVDPVKSEPAFITYVLPDPLPLVRLRTVSFRYKLLAADADAPALESFKLRLRTADTAFNDYDVPLAFGAWQDVTVNTKAPDSIRNIWGKIFGEVRQLTFRLDDVDSQNARYTLLVDDIVATVDQPAVQPYSPTTLRLKPDNRLDVLLVRHAAASPSTYALDYALQSVDTNVQTRMYPFKGLHFDLSLFGFPQKLDPLLSTDLIALIDVDPFIMSPQQAAWLADLVHSGAGLIFFGGGNTLANSKDFKRPIADLLPVTFTPGSPAFASRKLALGPPHFIHSGITAAEPWIANSAQKLDPKPGAAVILSGDDRPIVIAGEFGKGRVAVVNAQPGLDAANDLFADPAWAQMAPRLIQWLVRREGQPLRQVTLNRDLLPATPPTPAKLNRENLFPIITMVGAPVSGHYLSATDLRAEVEKVRAAGFNTLACGGLNNLARPQDQPAAATRNTWFIQRLAHEMGLANIFEYTGFNMVARDAPTSPCVFSPEYPQALAEKLGPQLNVAMKTPNLLSVKILDEPTVSPKSMDYCEHCQRVFRERYGIPLRKFEEIPADAVFERWAFADFMGHYVAEGYRQGYEFKQKSGADFDLLLTYMSTGLGYDQPLSHQQDALDWSRYADRMDFDVYPYFYPVSQKIRMLQAAWCMAYMRQLSRHLDKPWGFYVELDDRNWPFQQNPKEASAECAYEALLHGADYLNSFIHRLFATGCDARPERWDWTAQELRKVNAIGPLLTRLARPASPVAIFYPTAQNFIANVAAPKPYTHACLTSGFGDVDVLPEEVALEQKAISPRALVMLGCDTLHADMVPLLEQWVRDGGLLVLDRVPERNHRGEAIKLPFAFHEAREGGEPEMLPFYECAVGKGRVVRMSFDPEAAYREAVENDRHEEAANLRQRMAEVVGLLGAKPNAVVADRSGQMEVGVRQGKDMALVIVLNHAAEASEGVVTVSCDFKPAWARQLFAGKAAMAPVRLSSSGERHTFRIKLPARQAAMILLAPGEPAGVVDLLR